MYIVHTIFNITLLGLLTGTPKPWNQTLVGESNAENWTYEIRPNEGTIGEAQRTAKLLTKPKLQI